MVQNQEKTALEMILSEMGKPGDQISISGLSRASTAYMAAQFSKKIKTPMVMILSSIREAETMLGDLQFFIGNSSIPIYYFPPYHVLPFKSFSYHSETAAARIRTLYQLIAEPAPFVVTTVEALMQKLIPKSELIDFSELIMTHEEFDRDQLIQKLVSGGYTHSMIAEEPGDYCVRGGILDIFSPLYPDPMRIEMAGDTVDSMRFFSAATQRKLKSVSEAIVLPAKEIIIKKDRLNHIKSRIRSEAAEQDLPVTQIRKIINHVDQMEVFPGIESLTPLIYEKLDTLFDYIDKDALFMVGDNHALEDAADKFQQLVHENYRGACGEKRLCVRPEALYLNWSAVKDILDSRSLCKIESLEIYGPESSQNRTQKQWHFSIEETTGLKEQLKRPRDDDYLFMPLADWINKNIDSGCNVFLLCKTAAQAERIQSLLKPYGFSPHIIDHFISENRTRKEKMGNIFISVCPFSHGFVWKSESLAILTDEEIFGVKHRRRKRSEKGKPSIRILFEDLKKRDLVVHSDHGIGRYEGLVTMTVGGVSNDFLLIFYKDEDKLYLPIERMNIIQKYLGVDGINPNLDKMGGKSWDRMKKQVKASAEKMAGELLRLFAARKVKKGHAFGAMDQYYQDFEAAFLYEETSDQLDAIADVFHDMKKTTPMDRLICGDVGYGKTEVALRATYMAINDGKQVAILVPTTVLAEQHYETFSQRFKRYPVLISCLSRFRSRSEQKSILEALKSGKTDIIIGTHRLLQKDVIFKDLGLIVLDEEQRFGVKHKEKLKNFRRTVDVLALTATPIPRTLHLSLLGVRDISVIMTPPEQRRPVITYVSELDDGVIAEAIRKELRRKGQIFFVHNNIHGIWKMADHLKELVPEVRLGVAHGRLNEKILEQVMRSVLYKEIDMLVCTSIIESGLDIPSANTILINRADRFGLAQIYQLRGRVGRSDEQAYAYLFIPKGDVLGRDAQKRLKVLMEHSDLGSGFQIAMRDLEIRGGGSILGASQSGHIAAVGYDMFLKLMKTAVSELKGEPVLEVLEPEINFNLSAFIPASYIPNIDQRLSIYRRLARIDAVEEIIEFKNELSDRFGGLPTEVTHLLLKISLKILAAQACVKRLDINANHLLFHFSETHLKDPGQIISLIQSNPGTYALTPDYVMKVALSKGQSIGVFKQTKKILKEISRRV